MNVGLPSKNIILNGDPLVNVSHICWAAEYKTLFLINCIPTNMYDMHCVLLLSSLLPIAEFVPLANQPIDINRKLLKVINRSYLRSWWVWKFIDAISAYNYSYISEQKPLSKGAIIWKSFIPLAFGSKHVQDNNSLQICWQCSKIIICVNNGENCMPLIRISGRRGSFGFVGTSGAEV